nr:hypothetical protein [Tanacetum cinerariifolium]
MDTTIEQQVVIDEALFPSAQRIPGQSFAELPFEEEILDFIQFLGHSANIRTLTDVNINKLYHLRLSQAQILWGLYHKRNVDYAFLMWEDFVFQVEHKNQKKSNEMYYPRFTKVVIHHFMLKDPSIPRRNKFGALLPIELTNEEIRNSKAYKEYYAIAIGEAAPKPKASARRTRSGSDTSITPPTAVATPRLTAAAKGKQTAKASKAKSLSALSEVAMTEAQQLKLATRRSIQQTHISQPSGSGADEGTGADDEGKVDDDDEEDEKDDGEEGEEDDDDEDKDDDDEDQEVAKNDDKDDTEESGNDDEEGGSDEEDDDEETREEESFNPIPRTLESSEDEGNGAEDQGLNISEEERLNEEEEADELYRDVNINQERGMEPIFETASTSVAPLPITAPTMTPSTIITTSQAPILSTIVSSDIIQHLPSFGSLFRFDDRLRSLEENFSEFRQTNQFVGAVSAIPGIVHRYMDQQMNEAVRVAIQIQSDRLRDEAQKENDKFLRSVDENMKKIIKEQVKEQVKVQFSKILPRIKQVANEKLEAEALTRSSHSSRTSYALVEAYEADKIILDTYGETVTLKRRRYDDADKDKGPSTGPDRGSKRRREGKEPESASAPSKTATRSAGKSTTGSRSRQASASESAFAEDPPQKPPTLDRDWNKTLPTVYGSIQPWISELAKQADTRSSFNELMDTPLEFSNFIMNRLRVDTLTSKLLVGPTYDLMKGSCKSLIELEYHLEEVYKATTDQLDWVNPEGQQYPHNLLQPLQLIFDNRGRRVIPFAHFINNDLEYLRGGASSRKYTTSVMKTEAANYGHIKWIEDLVHRTMWIQEPIDYDKHALWGVSHWRGKRQQFYGFAVNWESARDVYSKRRIIVVTELKIVEWHSYTHLDWITVRRDDNKLYKFKEGDFKRLHLQDIEDMLLLLVQGKLTNLTVEERFAFNVSLQMFTRSIVIQRRVKDLQLGVESYQKKLNLTKPDMYQSDLKSKEAYTAYSNPRGFIYQNKDKKNRLMQIDELHKFSDGTLIDVRTALDDRLKGIRM